MIVQTPDSQWEDRLIKEQKEEIEKDKPEIKGIYFSQDIKEKQYYLDNQINPYFWNNWRFINAVTTSGLDVFIVLFSVIVVSGIVSNEFSLGTIKLLVTRPYHRWKILLSKYIASLIYTLFLLMVYFLGCYVIGGFLFGFTHGEYPLVYKSTVGNLYEMSAIKSSFLVITLRASILFIITTLAFMLSSLIKNQSVSLGLSILMLFGGSILGGVSFLTQFSWYKYTLFPHLNLVAYINADAGVAIQEISIYFSIIVLAIYWIAFLAIAFVAFEKKDISV